MAGTKGQKKPKRAADRLLDEVIARQLLFLRVREGLVAEQLELFDDAYSREMLATVVARLPQVPDLGWDTTPANSGRLAQLLAKLDDVAKEAFSKVAAKGTASLVEAAKLEAAWAAKALKKVLPIEVRLGEASLGYLRSIVVTRPFQGTHLKDWYKRLESDTKTRVRREIQQGLQQGQSVQAIARRLAGTKAAGYADGALAAPRRQIEAVVRTAANHVSTHAREATYEANRGLISGVRWVSTLDSRTTLTCAALDGQVFEMGQGPRPPQHFACRSTTVPVLRSWRELGFDRDEIPATTRASLDGQVPADLTFEAWFQGRSEAFQKAYLGPARFELYQQGLQIRDMLTPSWKPLPVSALRAA